jgi:hypothetical protein
VFDPLDFVSRLVALVPAPRANLVRYHGVLAPRARWRAQVVRDRSAVGLPCAAVVPGPARPARSRTRRLESSDQQRMDAGDPLRERRLTWAALMQRVWAKDVLECARCSGRLTLVATITRHDAIAAILHCIGLPTRAPPVAPSRELPQRDLWPG